MQLKIIIDNKKSSFLSNKKRASINAATGCRAIKYNNVGPKLCVLSFRKVCHFIFLIFCAFVIILYPYVICKTNLSNVLYTKEPPFISTYSYVLGLYNENGS